MGTINEQPVCTVRWSFSDRYRHVQRASKGHGIQCVPVPGVESGKTAWRRRGLGISREAGFPEGGCREAW